MATLPKSKFERMHVEIERATLHDVSGIQSVLLANKKDPSLLQRSRLDIQRNIRDFLVATDEHGRLLGCAALHFHTPRIAECLSLAVTPTAQGKGIGPRLLEESEAIAAEQKVELLWLTTANPEYFARLGYTPITRFSLPPAIQNSKMRQFLDQPMSRWIPALLWRFTFMRKKP